MNSGHGLFQLYPIVPLCVCLIGPGGQQQLAPTRRTTVDVSAMLGLGTHTGDAYQARQLVEETFLVFPDILLDFHFLSFVFFLLVLEAAPQCGNRTREQ